jgi:hypothetical protein
LSPVPDLVIGLTACHLGVSGAGDLSFWQESIRINETTPGRSRDRRIASVPA